MLKKNPKLSRFFIYYFLSICLIYLAEHVLFSSKMLQIFNLNEHLISDIQFNDLYYKKQGNTGPDTYMDKEKKIILVNTQEIPNTVAGREMYISLFSKLNEYKVAVIGVDVTFSKHQKDVFQSVKYNPKIIFADQDSSSDISFPNNGDIRFPKLGEHEQRSIRYYKNIEHSFGAKIVKAAFPLVSTNIGNNENFIIHYNSFGSGLSHLINDDNSKNNHWNEDYKFLNASDILLDSSNRFKDNFNRKIVIVGYLGNRKHLNADFDIEDKKRVPVDIEYLVNRDPKMFGAVIHANAISTILDKDLQFYEVSESIILVINLLTCALFLYVLLFKNWGKLWNRIILFVLTIPMLFIILYLMDFGIYYKFGSSLLVLLVIEEMHEILDPYDKKYLTKLLKND
jgi:hypothetical protein